MDNTMKEGESMMDNFSSSSNTDMQGEATSSSEGGMMDSMEQKSEDAYMKNGKPLSSLCPPPTVDLNFDNLLIIPYPHKLTT